MVAAYEKQQREENNRLAEKSAYESEKASREQQKQNRIALATTRINRLHGHNYQPENMEELISQAQSALDACAKYSEYASLKALFDEYVAEIRALPTWSQYNYSNSYVQPTATPVPDFGEPDITEAPVQ